MKGLFATIVVLGFLHLKYADAAENPEQERLCVKNCMASGQGYDMIACNNNICPTVITCCNVKGAEIGHGIVTGKMSRADCCRAIGPNGAAVFLDKDIDLAKFAMKVAKSSEEE